MTNEPAFHVYQVGQNLIEIAVSHGIALADLLAANGLTEQSMLFPGQRLILPSRTEIANFTEKPSNHEVKLGETLAAIAANYGLRLADLQRINGLSVDSVIFPGKILKLIEQLPPKPSSLENLPKHCLIHGYHKVIPGDQLPRIAAFHGVSTQALLSANNLSWNSIVSPGSKIVIPISHGPLDCPNLVQLSDTAMTTARSLVGKAKEYDLTEIQVITALCSEMQRSGLLPDLAIAKQTEKLLSDLAQVTGFEGFGVKKLLEHIGYIELAEGAARWEPSAWLWLDQIGSTSV